MIQRFPLDARELGFPARCFDKIVAMEVIEHIPNYHEMLAEVCRVLKDDGTLILSTPNFAVTQKITFGEHTQEFTKEELSEILGEYFREIEFFGLGRTQSFLSNVYSQARQSPLHALYRTLPPALRSLIQYPVYRLCYGKAEVKPFEPQKPSPIIVAVCHNFFRRSQ